MYSDKDLNSVCKISPVLYNIMHCHEMLYFYHQHAGPSLTLVDCISLDEYYHINPVNICWLRHSTGARLDINLVFCYQISTHSF